MLTWLLALPFGDVYAPQLGTALEDLSTDYEDFATSIEGLGYLESGITEPLNKFASAMLEFARLERATVSFRAPHARLDVHSVSIAEWDLLTDAICLVHSLPRVRMRCCRRCKRCSRTHARTSRC